MRRIYSQSNVCATYLIKLSTLLIVLGSFLITFSIYIAIVLGFGIEILFVDRYQYHKTKKDSKDLPKLFSIKNSRIFSIFSKENSSVSTHSSVKYQRTFFKFRFPRTQNIQNMLGQRCFIVSS